ncbi:UTP--glucose-1-phosphate uridylyltransferase [Bienertia sinuspersici]
MAAGGSVAPQQLHFPKLSRLFVVIFILLLLVVPGLHGSPKHRKRGMSSVFSLFNLKEKSRFWTESVIHGDFDDLESSNPGKSGIFNYTKAGNIATYLKLQEVDSMHFPVPLNFIFIGFEGKGNQAFRLQPEELERWFTKIDHVFEHTRVPQIEELLNPFYKINVDKGSHHFPTLSHVNYNFSVHAIQMNEKVTSVLERAITVLSRKDDVSGSGESKDALWQVDLDMMEGIFDSLIEYLQLGNAYNIFVLNPKRDINMSRYGYRRGLSESEMNFIKQNKTLQVIIRESKNIPESTLAIEKIQRPLYEKHPMVKFAWTTTEETDTVEWSNRCLEALDTIEKLYQGKDTDHIIQSKVLQVLNGKSGDLKLALLKELKSGDISNLHAECLTDTWIGKDRWAFIDLSAGPFTWGPAVGGQGVRTEESMPNVTKTIGAVAALVIEISEEEAEDRLQDAIQERFAVFGDKEHEAIDILLAEIDIYELFYFKHCKGRKVKLALCEELDERMQELVNELQVMEGDENDENHRRKAVEALTRMENWNLFSDTDVEFHNYTVARDTFLAHLGSTLWGSMRHVIAPSVADGRFHFYEQISYQLFFITQDKVRNVKQLPVDLKALMDGLSSVLLPSQKVMFSQHMLPLSDDPALAMAFSVARRAAAVPMLFVNGTYRKMVSNYLDSSILQHQLQRINDHNALKGKHANSRLTLEVPIFWFIHDDPLLVDKHYQAKALSDMIIVVQSETSSWESHFQCNGHSILWDLSVEENQSPDEQFGLAGACSGNVIHHIPLASICLVMCQMAVKKKIGLGMVFLFGEKPVSLIERMSGYGFAVRLYQSCVRITLSFTDIMDVVCEVWRPIKAAIAAASEHLAGLLPLHLAYSHAHETAIEDWIWSIGCNPFSITSRGWRISQFHSDTIARSYIITSLEESIQLVNSAIHRLTLEQTSEKSFRSFQSQERELVNKYNFVVGLWKRIATVTGELRYTDALRLLYSLDDASKGFAEKVNSTAALLHPIHCTRDTEVEVVFDMTTIPAFLFVFFILWLILKPKRAKPKIN